MLPDVPTLADYLPGEELRAWYGLGTPKDAPPEAIDTLNRSVNAALAEPLFKAQLADMGVTPQPGPPVELGRLIATDTEKMEKVIWVANINLE